MTSPALGLFFGLINTITLHIAKGMQRQGINALRWRRLPRDQRSRKQIVIYVTGVMLNNATPLWLILANRFSAPAYATGMFGIGLVLLLLYSSAVLREPVAPLNYLGAGVVVIGTLLFSIHSIRSGDLDVAAMHHRSVTLFIVVYLIVAAPGLVIGLRSRNARLIGLTFGFYAGGVACLDPILKAIGQNASGSATFFPAEPWGWLPFGLSFILGSSGFVAVQWAFLRGARASVLVPLQSSIYVLVPVVVQLIALPGYTATPLLILGMACIVGGIALMQAGREGAHPSAQS